MSTQPNHIFLSPSLLDTLAKNGITPEAYGPAYGGESAGLDLYYTGDKPFVIPPSSVRTLSDYDQIRHLNELEVRSVPKVLLPTGLHIALFPDRVALIQERSSVSKSPLKLRAGVIDAGYTGEIFCNCVNISARDYVIEPQSKLPFQLIVVPVFNQYQPVTSPQTWDEFTNGAKRLTAALGSSD